MSWTCKKRKDDQNTQADELGSDFKGIHDNYNDTGMNSKEEGEM